MIEITSGQIVSLSSILAIVLMGLSATFLREPLENLTLENLIRNPMRFYIYNDMIPNVLGVAKIIGIAVLLSSCHLLTDIGVFKALSILFLLFGTTRFIQILWSMANNYLNLFPFNTIH